MTQNNCDNSCPCRTPVCEETCPNFQFKERFTKWMAVYYPDIRINMSNRIVDAAVEIFDDLVM